jgi:hypothetical protein
MCRFLLLFVLSTLISAGPLFSADAWEIAAGPTRELPRAVRADDLASLMATVRRFAVTPRFDAGLRTRLADRVSYADLSRQGDRVLVSRTRDFVRGTLSDDLFVPYLQMHPAAAAGHRAVRRGGGQGAPASLGKAPGSTGRDH